MGDGYWRASKPEPAPIETELMRLKKTVALNERMAKTFGRKAWHAKVEKELAGEIRRQRRRFRLTKKTYADRQKKGDKDG